MDSVYLGGLWSFGALLVVEQCSQTNSVHSAPQGSLVDARLDIGDAARDPVPGAMRRPHEEDTMVKVTGFDIVGGKRKVEVGVFKSLQLTEGAYTPGATAVLRDGDGNVVASLRPGENWAIKDHGHGWDIVIADAG